MDIRTLETQWDEILRDGVIVDLTITRWHPSCTLDGSWLERLGAMADSEDARDAMKSAMRTGSIDLIPADAHRPVTAAAAAMRTNLYYYAHQIIFGWLLPARAAEAWATKHAELMTQWQAAVNNIVYNRDELMARQRLTYISIFTDAWARVQRIRNDVGGSVEFINEAISLLEAEVPSATEIAAKHQVSVDMTYAPTRDEVLEAKARAAEIRARAVVSQSEAKADRAAINRRFEAEVAATAERRRLQVLESMERAQRAFYQRLQDAVADLQSGLSERGKMTARNSATAAKLLNQVRALNVFGDSEIERRLEAMATSIANSNAGPAPDLLDSLDAITAHVQQTLAQIPRVRGVRRVAEVTGEAVEARASQRILADVRSDAVAPIVALRR